MINSQEVIKRFLEDEVSSQELYEAIYDFIDSVHIRNGEFEGNYFIIKKMDVTNFIIYAENIYPENIYPDENHREIPYSTSIYKENLLREINERARDKKYILKPRN
ncbi:hypothetical protein [Paenibacillus sp. BIC5C1]|uniref:hypothetical protein n=1 Tax=Paenibacillus sp. BIC5C1 TaxID=3078263 RepID=UPI0028E35F03|nr:hypothetical protein [Paenibacillus sp. BIC5C1]